MAIVVDIAEATDPRLADFVGLTDAGLRRRIEGPAGGGPGVAASGIFVAEGVLAVQQLLRSPYPLRSLLVAPERLSQLASLVAEAAPIYVAPHEVLAQVTGYHVHRGVLASAARLPLPDVGTVLQGAQRIVILAGVNDHENIGALFRNAAALGAQAVLLDPRCADPLYRRSVRVSTGHVLSVPFTRIASWPDDLEAVVGAAGFQLIALTPAADAQPLAELMLPPEQRVALVLGAEGPGLDPDVVARADFRCRIPLMAGIDSLNVATAGALALYELGRRGS